MGSGFSTHRVMVPDPVFRPRTSRDAGPYSREARLSGISYPRLRTLNSIQHSIQHSAPSLCPAESRLLRASRQHLD